MYFLLSGVVGIIFGWATGTFLKGSQYGLWVDIVMGIAGALGGELLIHYGGFPGRFEIVSTTLSAALGAVTLTLLAAFVTRRRRYA